MRTAVIGAVLLVLGAVAVLTGVLPLDALGELVERTAPILAFVVAVTVVAELASEAGVFTVVAERAAVWGRGRTPVLWLLVVVMAIVSTVFLSLDTTAVLLTPVVVLLAAHVKVSPLPFAMATVWLANCASLLLPVSNLTNLLAERRLGVDSPLAFASLTALPALVAAAVPVLILAVRYRRELAGRYVPGERTPVEDRVLLVGAGIVVALLLPALVSGLEVWIPAAVAALALVVLFAVRRRGVLRLSLLPWQLVVFASGLFVAMEAAHQLGLGAALAVVAGEGSDVGDLLRLAGSGAVASNLVDNLPAYLALEPVASDPVRLVALLIGVNAGPLITPWASLATLLWHQRLTALGVAVSWRQYALLGAVAVVPTVGGAVLALALTQV
ncbi:MULTISPECIES: SLC13 family permease [unclassified Rathayibacter]|uniref:SLC13 family permease n=1 Tax=unclassified Rathayibacter TaxID=2609250 RepID=UPI0006F5C57A|nr:MULTISPECIES: SLC13 family permease [unclassified Rathayibacter]KQQ04280.1 arsenic transporter [Rathayibacter sp. Leaf294]KQS12734.1 arsenic transporter [Rathayibacter sp. Leaf185]